MLAVHFPVDNGINSVVNAVDKQPSRHFSALKRVDGVDKNVEVLVGAVERCADVSTFYDFFALNQIRCRGIKEELVTSLVDATVDANAVGDADGNFKEILCALKFIKLVNSS